MEVSCSNCSLVELAESSHPILIQIFEEYYGDKWSNDLRDISMELCEHCGTCAIITYIESKLRSKTAKTYNLIIKEILDNQHIPFLLSFGGPIFVYLIEKGTPAIKKSSIDALGTYGALDDIGRFVISNFDSSIQILGLRALEKIEKHSKKRGLPFVWAEFVDIIINNDLEMIEKIEKKIKEKTFLKPETVQIIKKITTKRRAKLAKKLKS